MQAGDGISALREYLVPLGGVGRAPGTTVRTGSISEEQGDSGVSGEQHAAVPTGVAGSIRSRGERITGPAVYEKSLTEPVYPERKLGLQKRRKIRAEVREFAERYRKYGASRVQRRTDDVSDGAE